jgi:nitroreductase
MTSVRAQAGREGREVFEAAVREPCRVSHFLDDDVPREDVERMVGLATCAASACDAQAWRFIAIRDKETLAAMQAAVLARFEELAASPGLVLHERKRVAARQQALLFAKAPLCIAVAVVPVASPMEELLGLAGMSGDEVDRLCPHPAYQSVGAAVQLLTTSAHTMGYGTCWTCAPVIAGEHLEGLLEITPPARLVALVSIGRPGGVRTAHKRLPLDQVLTFR